MTLDLNDPESIAAWYRVHPKRHGPQLAWMLRRYPQFAPAIEKARELVKKT